MSNLQEYIVSGRHILCGLPWFSSTLWMMGCQKYIKHWVINELTTIRNQCCISCNILRVEDDLQQLTVSLMNTNQCDNVQTPWQTVGKVISTFRIQDLERSDWSNPSNSKLRPLSYIKNSNTYFHHKPFLDNNILQ